jgi:hypothetical protein
MLSYSIVTLVDNLNIEYHRKLRDQLYQGIAVEFVLQLIKMSSIQYRSCTTRRNGPGDRS